ncbi:hypothetical protein ACFQ48_05035 [Hymenobacter caeli]|uniref:Glucosamine inositolphosphorylceramide transferase 1 N-terminal domain-containing protein n=1 Tax=Hymenobacter caeli TaxID=2735894 RepID=A0ABX2FQ76_9BACT|nr:hypothetical protein [Hymenobacter caeli]NRT19321.1 hypothetical protein [Hymenobacter caeli]
MATRPAGTHDLPPAPRLACAAPRRPGAGPDLTAADLAAVADARLDFLLSFVDAPLSGPVLAVPRFGVWAFGHGPAGRGPGWPVGLWEAFHREPTVAAALHRLGAAGPGPVLRQGVFRTSPHRPAQAAAGVYAECAHWPADVCRQLLAGLALPAGSGSGAPAPAPARGPSGPALLGFAARLAGDQLRDWYRTFLRADQWNMGVVDRPVQDFLRPNGLRGAVVDAPPLPNRNVFYADSFVRQEDGGPMVYFELYDYRTRRGNISRLPYPWQPGRAPVAVLGFPYHLSYPFLFGPYCMPEAWKTNRVQLYDLRAPVTDPTAGQVLLEAPAVDATLLEYQGRYWLFYARADRDPMLNLFISYADALAGPWHEHPQNPVKTNVRSARPAGPFFEADGKLYRPAQDCARDYGAALTFHEVLALTPTEYTEREVAHVTSPHPGYPAGMHTVMALDATRTLVDFKRYRFIPMASLLAVWIRVAGVVGRVKNRRKPVAKSLPAS